VCKSSLFAISRSHATTGDLKREKVATKQRIQISSTCRSSIALLQARDTIRIIVSQARDTIGIIVSQARDTIGIIVSQARDTVGIIVSQAGDTIGIIVPGAQYAVAVRKSMCTDASNVPRPPTQFLAQ
jgi:phage-related protein